MLDPYKIIQYFYPEDNQLRQLLLLHSEQVRDKALELRLSTQVQTDENQVRCAALLHDIGVGLCHAPSIYCFGPNHYLLHGTLGAERLRQYARNQQEILTPQDSEHLEICARVCERHTGCGLTADVIAAQKLPLPPKDLVPETPVEEIVCLADKFFSKSDPTRMPTAAQVRKSLEKYGNDTIRRFDELCTFCGLTLN